MPYDEKTTSVDQPSETDTAPSGYSSDWNKLTIYIPASLRKQFRLACMTKDRSMSDVLRDIIADYISEQKPPDND